MYDINGIVKSYIALPRSCLHNFFLSAAGIYIEVILADQMNNMKHYNRNAFCSMPCHILW